MSILSDSEIINAVNFNKIKIEPYNEKSLGSNSYDLHLSNKLAFHNDYAIKVRDEIRLTSFNGDVKFIDCKDTNLKDKYQNIEIPQTGIILNPGVLYLISSIEYTETGTYVPFIEGKSSIGRLGIKVHMTAGMGDAGFYGHWTFQIEVMNRIKIYPGMAFAQLYFFTTGFIINPYNKKSSAKYNNTKNIPMPSKYYENFDETKDFKEDIKNLYQERFRDSGIAGIPEDED